MENSFRNVEGAMNNVNRDVGYFVSCWNRFSVLFGGRAFSEFRSTGRGGASAGETAAVLGAGIALCCFNYGRHWNAFYYAKWTMILLLVSLLCSVWAAKRVGWVLLPLLVTVIASGLYFGAWYSNPYVNSVDPLLKMELGKAALSALLSGMLFMWAAAVLPRRLSSPIRLGLSLVSISAAIVTISGNPAGFVGNQSMNGCLIAATLPFLSGIPILMVPGLIAVFMTGASQPLIIAIPAVVLLASSLSWKAWAPAFLSFAGSALWLFPRHHALLYSNGRFEHYKTFMLWWWHHANGTTGAGLGSSFYLLGAIQRATGDNGDIYLFMHSSWLQILFELGLPGLISAVVVYFALVERSLHSPKLLASWVAFGLMAVFNYPIQAPIHAACFAGVAWLIIQEGGEVLGS